MTDGSQPNHFFHATMRHFAELRRSTAPTAPGAPAFPKDWFDLPDAFLADFGAIFYLASLTRYHQGRSLVDLFASFEPPLRLGQYKIFRSEGYPRAVITWAGLSAAKEYSFGVGHQPLQAQDWNSGTSVWLIDFIAPFGHIDQIIPQLTANPGLTHVRTLWHNKTGNRYRIVEWSRPPDEAEIRVRSYGVGQFERLLKEGGKDGDA